MVTLAVSKKVETAIGLGIAVIFVLTVTTPLNQLLTVDPEQWREEMQDIGEYLHSYGERLPERLRLPPPDSVNV